MLLFLSAALPNQQVWGRPVHIERAELQTQSSAPLRPVAYLPVLATVRPLPDAFEPDDTCVATSTIVPGNAQSRTFAALTDTLTITDIDIIQVHFTQAGSYDARVAATNSQLSPRVELATVCGAAPLDAFTPSGPVRLIVPSANYTLYFRAASLNLNVLRLQNTDYRLSLSGMVSTRLQANDIDETGPRIVILPDTQH